MHATLTWQEIAARLAWTMAAGTLVGLDRDERGKAAGIRTNVLVCLAASLSMLLANALLEVGGKRADSFSVMDTLRLPLGILSGLGFIGAGAILRRGSMVLGVTTAATLWMVTMLGLCFGGGAIGVGAAGLALTMLTLWGLRAIEARLAQQVRGRLRIVTREADMPGQLRALLKEHGLQIREWKLHFTDRAQGGERVAVECELRWRTRDRNHEPPAALGVLRKRPDIEELEWQG
jgi:putative Mg2+ transporter-C (MgtC) family protein